VGQLIKENKLNMPQKQKRPVIVSPVGEIKFAFVTTPRVSEYSPDGSYSVTLVLDPSKPEVQEFKAKLDAEAKAAREEKLAAAEKPKDRKAIEACQLSTPLKPELDSESGEPTGKLVLDVKEEATYKDRKSGETKKRTVPIFDAKKSPLVGPKIGRGTKARVAFTTFPYAVTSLQNPTAGRVGVSGYLKGLQIIELVEYQGGASADALGFAEEEGYVATAGEESSGEQSADGTGF
jgi:hypothetical protein